MGQQSNGVNGASRGKRIAATSARVLAAALLIAMGLLALIYPTLTGLSAASVVPIFLILSGAVGLFDGLSGYFHADGGVNWAEAAFGLIYLILGFLLASNAFAAAFTLGVAVAAAFLSQTFVAIVAVFTDSGHRLWMLVLAACNAFLAWMAFAQWPLGAMELVGIWVGISVLSWGIALLSGGFHTQLAKA